MIDDARDDRETTEAPDTTRRRLLGTAAGGFALAASGLLLPDWLVEEAAADNHPVRHVQHRAEKRRQRRHHRLTQKRRRQRRSGSQPRKHTPGGSLIKSVAVIVEGQDRFGQRQPWPGLQVDFHYRIKGLGDSWSDLQFALTADASSSPATYAPERYRIAAFVRGPDFQWPGYVEVPNPFIGSPWGTIWRGGAITGGVYAGGTEFWPESYGVGTTGAVSLKGGGAHNSQPDIVLEVTRLDDTDTHKLFMVVVRPSDALDHCGINVGC